MYRRARLYYIYNIRISVRRAAADDEKQQLPPAAAATVGMGNRQLLSFLYREPKHTYCV